MTKNEIVKRYIDKAVEIILSNAEEFTLEEHVGYSVNQLAGIIRALKENNLIEE